MYVGSWIRELRESLNKSMKEVADFLGIATITYNHYETQEKIIPLSRLNELLFYFDTSFDYLFKFVNIKNYKNSKKDINRKIVGQRLKDFRKENKITQVKLAEILNTVHPVITNYENGKNLIATPFLYTICKKYQISADYLLGKVDEPKYLK